MKWEPVAVMVLILVVTVCTVILMAGLKPLIHGGELPDQTKTIIEGVVLSLTNIISVFVGAKIQRRKDGEA